MNAEQTQSAIKSKVRSFLPEARVFMFGSRARGDDGQNSDYDLLIIIKNNFPGKEKREWSAKLSSALVNTFHAPFDIVLQTEEEVNVYKNYYGHIVRYAVKEAIEL